ncbi:hypothetical protein D3C85_1456150 [compost metagenome]
MQEFQLELVLEEDNLNHQQQYQQEYLGIYRIDQQHRHRQYLFSNLQQISQQQKHGFSMLQLLDVKLDLLTHRT